MDTKAIRERVLSLAIQGKLLPQDATDEPASVLLERIRKERAELIKQKKIKAPKNESVIFRGDDGLFYERVGKSVTCIQDEIPFEIPSSWEWVRLGEIVEIIRGSSPRPIQNYLTNSPDGINWIKIGDTQKGDKFIHTTKEKILPSGLKKSCKVNIGDFLLSNSMSFGRPYILNIDGAIHDGWLAISNYSNVFNRDFLFYLLSSPFAFHQFSQVASGAVVKNLNKDKVSATLFLIPPLGEQKRICTSIENVLANVDEIEKNQIAIESDFKRLKEKALDLAIRGKLLPQNPDDEPASELLERIRKEKQALIKAKKIKAPKQESFIYRKDDGSFYERIGKTEICIDDEIPFDIPNSWEWVRLGVIFELNAGKFIRSTEIDPIRKENSYPCYGGNGVRGYVQLYNTEGDYPLIGRQGALCGNVHRGTGRFYATEHAIVAKSTAMVSACSCYYLKAMNLNQYATSTAQPGLSVNTISQLLIPLPPIQEQKRISSTLENILIKLAI